MANVHPLLDAARLLHDLQRVNEIAQSISGNLDPDAVARQLTDALVERFGCAFARIWLLESDRATLRLVASSGLYTHTDGSFAKVPMGAYKVGKIAQNQVPFLSNNLPEESWVKDRQWALDNQIQGFAGYPLAARGQVIGVLAAFSHRPFAAEFLEVMQVLCMTLTVALAAAFQATQSSKPAVSPAADSLLLSDRIAAILRDTRPMLVGTERSLPVSLAYGFLRTAELLQRLGCSYCRLSYGHHQVALEAIARQSPDGQPTAEAAAEPLIADLIPFAAYLGGRFQSQPVTGSQAWQVLLELPYVRPEGGIADDACPPLSTREQQVMQLLAEGKRDREIAQELYISESTVKFHINNSLTKLSAKNRYQGVYQATLRGWI